MEAYFSFGRSKRSVTQLKLEPQSSLCVCVCVCVVKEKKAFLHKFPEHLGFENILFYGLNHSRGIQKVTERYA